MENRMGVILFFNRERSGCVYAREEKVVRDLKPITSFLSFDFLISGRGGGKVERFL